MEEKKEIEEKIKKAKELSEELDEPFKSITFKTLLERFLQEEKTKKIDVNIPLSAESVISSNIPQITQKSSCRETIIALLSTEWGKHPKMYKEIKEALETNAIYYPDNTLWPTLTLMTKKGELRRLKTGKIYSYVLSNRGS